MIPSSNGSSLQRQTTDFRVSRKPVKWGRRQPNIPDRHFYHLFFAGKSTREIASTLYCNERTVRVRLDKLVEAGWITPRQRKRWRSSLYQRRRSSLYYIPQSPKNLPLYRRVAHLLQEGDYSIKELVELTSSPKGTITRYAALWKSKNLNYYRKIDNAEDT